MEIIGQSRIQRVLADQLQSGRIAHAYLFHGIAGVGKAALAMAFARGLVCPTSTGAPCDECPDCRLTKSLRHPDLHLVFPLPSKKGDESESEVIERLSEPIRKATEALAGDPYAPTTLPRSRSADAGTRQGTSEDRIRTELIRLVIREASLKPFQSARKVFVIFHADSMMEQAQNAFLKLLEDPPQQSYFLLITDNLQDVLPTIRSRCQKVLVPAVPAEEMVPMLTATGLTLDQARAISLISGGSVTRARSLTKANVAELQELSISFLRSAATCDALELGERIATMAAAHDHAVNTILEMLSILLRDVASFRFHPADQNLTFASHGSTLRRLISSYPHAELDAAAAAIDTAKIELERNLTPEWVFYVLALRLNRALGKRVVASAG